VNECTEDGRLKAAEGTFLFDNFGAPYPIRMTWYPDPNNRGKWCIRNDFPEPILSGGVRLYRRKAGAETD
jgi:hypothetical protein